MPLCFRLIRPEKKHQMACGKKKKKNHTSPKSKGGTTHSHNRALKYLRKHGSEQTYMTHEFSRHRKTSLAPACILQIANAHKKRLAAEDKSQVSNWIVDTLTQHTWPRLGAALYQVLCVRMAHTVLAESCSVCGVNHRVKFIYIPLHKHVSLDFIHHTTAYAYHTPHWIKPAEAYIHSNGSFRVSGAYDLHVFRRVGELWKELWGWQQF